MPIPVEVVATLRKPGTLSDKTTGASPSNNVAPDSNAAYYINIPEIHYDTSMKHADVPDNTWEDFIIETVILLNTPF